MDNDRKILFVTHSSKPAGAEFVMLNLLKAFKQPGVFLFEDGPLVEYLKENSIDYTIATSNKNMSDIKRDRSLLYSALPLSRNMASLVLQIANKSKDYDIIYANSQKAFVLASFASLISRKKLVWHCHDILTGEHFKQAQIRLDIGLAKLRATRIIVPSEACADAIVKAGGSRNSIRVLPNGIATLAKDDMPVHKHNLREALGLPEGFIYGVFSRLAEWKGQHIAIEALKYVPTAKCLIVGGPQFGEDQYAKSLQRLAVDLGLQDRVIFLGHRTDVPMIMNAIDAFCQPSISAEPFGLTVLEAMRASLPVVATNAGGIPEIIESEVTGLLVPPNDPIALGRAIRSIMHTPDRTSEMVVAARQVVNTKFTIERMLNDIQIIISEI